MCIAAALPQWRAERSDSRWACAFLLPKLSSGDRNVAACLGRRGTLPRIGEVMSDRRMNERFVEGRTEHSIRKFDFPNFFVLQIAHLNGWHNQLLIFDCRFPIFDCVFY